jgi:hypothetical protein
MSTRFSLTNPPTMASLRSAAGRDVDHDGSHPELDDMCE